MVDNYLRNEASDVKQAVTASVPGERQAPVAESSAKPIESEPSPQQSLPLDEPDQNAARVPSSGAETARSVSSDKPA